MVRLPPSRHTLHCGLRIPDLRARDDSPLRRSCHHVGPASCRTRRLRAQRIRRCGLNATFRTRLQRCDGDWWPLSLRHSRVAHAAPFGTNTERTAAQHQSLLHFIGEGRWSDEKVLAKVRELVLPQLERHGPVEAWIIDDTSFPKKGQHSVGVARQYCGELGKQDNCQVAVTLSIANHDASLPVAYRLYLPKDWASGGKRPRHVGIPDEISFKTKPEIALAQIRWACEAGLPRGVVLMDAGYGVDTDLRTSLTVLGLSYVAGIQSHTTVWAPGTGPRPPKKVVGPWATTEAAAPRR